jgi:hypothetical protein
MGFNIPDPVRTEHLYPWNAVGLAATAQLLERRQFIRIGGDHQLAATVDGNPALFGVELQRCLACPAELCLQRARLVVEPSMENAAVVTGLVGGETGFLI